MDDYVVVTRTSATFVICDDCREAYPEPAYYSFDTDACTTTGTDDQIIQHMDDPVDGPCTGNMCPDCAGPYLWPDDQDDPRKPADYAP
jgi:hypothetical protein